MDDVLDALALRLLVLLYTRVLIRIAHNYMDRE